MTTRIRFSTKNWMLEEGAKKQKDDNYTIHCEEIPCMVTIMNGRVNYADSILLKYNIPEFGKMTTMDAENNSFMNLKMDLKMEPFPYSNMNNYSHKITLLGVVDGKYTKELTQRDVNLYKLRDKIYDNVMNVRLTTNALSNHNGNIPFVLKIRLTHLNGIILTVYSNEFYTKTKKRVEEERIHENKPKSLIGLHIIRLIFDRYKCPKCGAGPGKKHKVECSLIVPGLGTRVFSNDIDYSKYNNKKPIG